LSAGRSRRPGRPAPSWLTLAVTLAAALAACGGGSAPPGRACPDDAPNACPDGPAPHFSTDAWPIIQGHCYKCHHAVDGQAWMFPFGSYDQISPYAGDMMLQLETCQMPPLPEPALSEADRHTLMNWIICGALDD
jgi:hypothetical protein